jgi:tryptophanyl-tRNA synthetase
LLDWLAAGVNPEKSTILLQSAVPEHAELSLLLGMLVTVPRLERNPTYRDQVEQLGLMERASVGLLTYPVLQGADILIYRADSVPVGEDQLPHIELAREMARRFNHLYGSTFPEPQAILSETPRFPGTDGRTMHTSYGNVIALSATPEEIRQLGRNMVTDPQRARRSDPGRPEVCPVQTYHDVLDPEMAAQIAQACSRAEVGCVEHKEILVNLLVRRLEPHRRIRQETAGREDELWEILREGSRRARMLAQVTLSQVRDRLGLVNLEIPPGKAPAMRGALDLAGKICC